MVEDKKEQGKDELYRCKDDRAMRPIYVCPDIFESP